MPKRVIWLFSVEFMSRLLPINLAGEPFCDPGSLGHRKLLCSVGVSRFSVDFFGLTVLKNFVGNPFNLPEIFGFRNFLCMRTENHVLQSKIFVAQYAKIYWEPILSFRILGISETFIRITVFLRFFLSHSTENFVRNYLMFQKESNVRYRKNSCIRTEYHGFSSKIFHLRVPKDFVVELFGKAEKFVYRKISCLRGWYHFSPLKFIHLYCL